MSKVRSHGIQPLKVSPKANIPQPCTHVLVQNIQRSLVSAIQLQIHWWLHLNGSVGQHGQPYLQQFPCLNEAANHYEGGGESCWNVCLQHIRTLAPSFSAEVVEFENSPLQSEVLHYLATPLDTFIEFDKPAIDLMWWCTGGNCKILYQETQCVCIAPKRFGPL